LREPPLRVPAASHYRHVTIYRKGLEKDLDLATRDHHVHGRRASRRERTLFAHHVRHHQLLAYEGAFGLSSRIHRSDPHVHPGPWYDVLGHGRVGDDRDRAAVVVLLRG